MKNDKDTVKTFVAKRKVCEGYTVEYKVQAKDKDEASQKVYRMCGERLKVVEK